MKLATLAIIVNETGEQVLLGHKKKGEIGAQTLNGPGGKCEVGESLVECVVRETKEEMEIDLFEQDLEKVAVITFYAAGEPDFEVHVFRTQVWGGDPQETADMVPGWYPVDDLPLERMLESDRQWFAKAVAGEKFVANVYYKHRAAHFEKIEFLPFI